MSAVSLTPAILQHSMPSPIAAASLALVGLTCMLGAVTQAWGARFSADSSSSRAPDAVVPRQGFDRVLVRPGSPGGLQVLFPATLGPKCLFVYTARAKEWASLAAKGEQLEPGWLYGAKLPTQLDRSIESLAFPTGAPGDLLPGHLCCWETNFAAYLQKADQVHNFDESRPETNAARRSVVSVVRTDGSSKKAFWYFQSKVEISARANISLEDQLLFVFDCDNTLWVPETFTLKVPPTEPVVGDLNGRGEGVVGLRTGSEVLRLHRGALSVLQEIADGTYPNARVALASSAPSYAVPWANRALDVLEVLPGLPLRKLVARGYPPDFQGNIQIGRSGRLSPDKRGHFRFIRQATGVDWQFMIFFDDWDGNTQQVAAGCPGVVTQHTPNGLTLPLWRLGLDKYTKRNREQS